MMCNQFANKLMTKVDFEKKLMYICHVNLIVVHSSVLCNEKG